MAFQPIADLDTGTVVGFESLARFEGDPLRSPAAWFSDAATVGLRGDLELTAARAAVSAFADLPEGAYLTVNASPDVAMSPAFIEAISSVPGARLVVEITEHAPIDDYGALNRALETLRARGVRVAIDDAGAGFANMNHILRIDADLIKLDVELTRHIDIDVRRKALVASLVEFARSVGSTIVAEGIETEAELRALRALGVRTGQGFHLGRPSPLAARASAHTGPREGRTPARLWRSAATVFLDWATFVRRREKNRRRPRAFRRVALLMTVALVLGPATAAFAENARPGTPGWWVKRRIEDVRIAVALDRESQVRLQLDFARRRLSELSEVLTDGDTQRTELVLASYRRNIESVRRFLPRAPLMSEGLRHRMQRELTDYVETLDGEAIETCPSDRSRHAQACRGIGVAARRSKAALAEVERLPVRPRSGRGGKAGRPTPHPSSSPEAGNGEDMQHPPRPENSKKK